MRDSTVFQILLRDTVSRPRLANWLYSLVPFIIPAEHLLIREGKAQIDHPH